jgi:hypothetical protein
MAWESCEVAMHREYDLLNFLANDHRYELPVCLSSSSYDRSSPTRKAVIEAFSERFQQVSLHGFSSLEDVEGRLRDLAALPPGNVHLRRRKGTGIHQEGFVAYRVATIGPQTVAEEMVANLPDNIRLASRQEAGRTIPEFSLRE